MAFEKEIKEYEDLRGKYQTLIINKMDREEYIKYDEVLFSTFSCAIEGNSFSVDDTQELKEKGLGMIPAGKPRKESFRQESSLILSPSVPGYHLRRMNCLQWRTKK